MRFVRVLGLGLALSLMSGVVFAQSGADKAAAQALFDEGQTLFKANDFAAACPKFEASLAKFDGLGTRGKLAECYEKVGRVASAWAMWREVGVLAKKVNDEKRMQIADARAKALAGKLPYLVLQVPEANRVDGLEVTRAGTRVDSGELGARVAVDPGVVQIQATAPGRKPWSKDVTLAEAQVETVEIPLLEVDPEAAAPVEQPSTSTGGSVTSDDLAKDPKTLRTVGMVAVGVGVASILVGGYFGLRASSKWNSAFDDGNCNSDTNVCNSEGQSQTDDARSAATLSNVFIGAGAAVAAGGVVMWVLSGKSASREKAVRHEKRIRLTPVVGQRDMGFALGGRF
jgi:hypothetical protein